MGRDGDADRVGTIPHPAAEVEQGGGAREAPADPDRRDAVVVEGQVAVPAEARTVEVARPHGPGEVAIRSAGPAELLTGGEAPSVADDIGEGADVHADTVARGPLSLPRGGGPLGTAVARRRAEEGSPPDLPVWPRRRRVRSWRPSDPGSAGRDPVTDGVP